MHLNNNSLNPIRRDERGSATLESMLVFPLILSVIVVMMLVVIYGYQQLYVQHISLTAAERASYNWDGRDRSFRTAQLQSDYKYNLYEDELTIVLLRQWFAVSDKLQDQQLEISRASEAEQLSARLLDDKLIKAKHYITGTNSGVEGKIGFTRSGFIPRFSVKLHRDISPLFWKQQILLPSPSYSAQYDIYAPTQFIRNVDLFLHYAKLLSSLSREQQQERKLKGGKAIKSFSSS